MIGALVVVLVLVIDCSNHYSRDYFGALEGELEKEYAITNAQYHQLTSLYFFASIPAPLLAGFSAAAFGAARVQLAAVLLAAIGSAIFLLGPWQAASPSFGSLLVSRFCLGISYEVIDSVWMPLLEPFVSARVWTTIAGTVNASQRAGSTLAFGLSPTLYSRGGARLATVVPSLVALAAAVPATLAALVAPVRPVAAAGSTPCAAWATLASFDGCALRLSRHVWCPALRAPHVKGSRGASIAP